jgi:hypothetical protein
MPNTEELTASAGAQDGDELEQEERQFQPGELCAEEATNARVELDPKDPQTTKREGCLKNLFTKVAQRDLVSRRREIREAWKARYFYRGVQHLLNGPKGTILPVAQSGLMAGQSFDDHSDETNIYLGFGDILVAALSGSLPHIRFEPDDPTNASDISAAENSEKARLLIERNNDMPVILADADRYLYTDGRAMFYARHIIDGQRFGYSNPGLSEVQDEVSYLPEEGETGPQNQPEEQGTPRGSEIVIALGVLETKIAIQANCLAETSYLQWSKEIDITRAKTKYPDKAEDIHPSQAPTAESDYERLARTSIMMGMRPTNMTSDSMTYNCTEQKTWVRPEFYAEETDDELREWLYDTFSKGCMGVMIGSVLCEQRNESMDDCWSMVHARAGDGAHRPALGSPVIPIQEKVNDCVDLLHESFMHLIPRVWVNPEIDVDGLQDAERRPGQYLKSPKAPAGKGIAENFFTEQQIEIAQGLIQYMQWLFGEAPQFLSGGSPALFGGDTGKNDTLGGITIQRDQALGRIGLTWRNIRAAYALTMRQAVQAAAEFRQETMSGSVPGQGQQLQSLAIDPNDLKGNIRCFPDQDDNFPESWVAKRAIWNNIIQMAEKNPVIGKILTIPQNLMTAKDKAGLPEMVIPGADSAEKQLGEIEILLQSGPESNPAVDQAKQQIEAAAQQAQASGVQIPPEAAQAVQQKLQQIPPMVSTVPVGKLDDHAAESQAIKTWANSSEGIKAKATNPDGFKNVETHYDEHVAALQAQQQGNQPAEKGPSESINFKDLPIDGQVQLAAKGGIQLDAGKMQVEEQHDKATELAAKAAQPKPMIQ